MLAVLAFNLTRAAAALSGRQLATAEARLVGADGTLYAHATTTCLVFEARVDRDAAATPSPGDR